MTSELRRIVEDLDNRRRALFEDAQAGIKALTPKGAAGRLDENERQQLTRWRELARYSPAVVDYLKAQLLVADQQYEEALALFERLPQAAQRPDLLLNAADLCRKIGRRADAGRIYAEVLAIDPDNVQAHLGICRLALDERDFDTAAHSALDALQGVHHNPQAHFLLGLAMEGAKDYARAADALRAAISFNPNFPEAHLRLAGVLELHLKRAYAAKEHRRLARRMRRRDADSPLRAVERPEVPGVHKCATAMSGSAGTDMVPPLAESLVIVSGLPRSGTSMLMQMLAAGGVTVISDGLREPDAGNPRGYFEFEPVKSLWRDSNWLIESKGKAVKIVAPLLTALPMGLPCRVILIERDMDEVLHSQDRMLGGVSPPLAASQRRRTMLGEEYERTLARVKALLTRRPETQLLIVNYAHVISDPYAGAQRMSRFLDGQPDVAKMAAAVEPVLHRVHKSNSQG
jgi:tetratricopeptide (TPR) repeat protein